MSREDGRIEIGAALRDARRRYGMEVREVEERTKIRAKYIRALENEDWATLPAPAYVRGFLRTYGQMLGLDGNLTLVGAPETPYAVSAFALLFGRKSLSGSLIGGIAETQEMLDFCGAHNITSDVEVIPIQQINQAYQRLAKADVKYRFSIDMASLK